MSVKYLCDICKQQFSPKSLIDGPLEIAVKTVGSYIAMSYVALTKGEHICQSDYDTLLKGKIKGLSTEIRNKANAIQS